MGARLGAMIAHAYRIMGDCTPLEADCGRLCGARCCQGDDAGMLLFPGEAARLAHVPGFRVERIHYMGGRAWLLSCDGVCDRALRPLSCRIFPLGPRIGADGRIRAAPDPRARGMCPLADGKHLDRRFKNAVRKTFRCLAAEPRMLRFMELLSQELEELSRFWE